jgi:hypothetical protein
MRSPPSGIRRGLKALGRLLLVALGLGVLGFLHSSDYLSTMGASPSGARLERIQRSPHWRDGVFQNLSETTVMVPGKGFEVMTEFLTLGGRRVPDKPLPTAPATRATFDAPPADGLRVTWLGHSTVLVELEGQRVLFDPVWAERSSPSRWAGPKRFQPVPLPIEEVPELAAIAISHDHYDHLDKAAVQALARAQPGVPFFVPLGVGAHLERWADPSDPRARLVGEDSAAGGKLRLVCAPARHFSDGALRIATRRRGVLVVTGSAPRVLRRRRRPGRGPGGDRQRYGPFDLTLLEIGAFHENWAHPPRPPKRRGRPARPGRPAANAHPRAPSTWGCTPGTSRSSSSSRRRRPPDAPGAGAADRRAAQSPSAASPVSGAAGGGPAASASAPPRSRLRSGRALERRSRRSRRGARRRC